MTGQPLNILLIIVAVNVFGAVLIIEPTSLTIPLIYGLLATLIFTALAASAISRLGSSNRLHVSINAISGTPGFLLCLVSFLVSLQLVSVWGGTTMHYDVVAGLLPHSDANAYYTSALGRLEGYQMSTFSSRRPLTTGYLATLLRVTGLSLPGTLTVLSAITGLLATLAACTVGRLLDAMVALWFVVLLFLFYNGFIGTTLSGVIFKSSVRLN